MKIFACIFLLVIHFILLGENLLVVGAVVEHEVGHHKAGDLLVLAELYQQVAHHLKHLALPAVSLGPQLLLLQVTDAAVWTSVQMPAYTHILCATLYDIRCIAD